MENKNNHQPESLSFKRILSAVRSWINKHRIISGFGSLAVLFVSLTLIFPSNQPVAQSPVAQPSVTNVADVQALKDFEVKWQNVGLIDSVNSNGTVYVDSPWYLMTVQQKDEFLQQLEQLKTAAFGGCNFDVRDAYSDEKVGGVTLFFCSPEVDR